MFVVLVGLKTVDAACWHCMVNICFLRTPKCFTQTRSALRDGLHVSMPERNVEPAG